MYDTRRIDNWLKSIGFTKEEITEICKIFEDFFSYLSDFYSNEDSYEISLGKLRITLFKTVIKSVQ